MREQPLAIGVRALNAAFGPDAGPPLLLLHGVTRCWQDFAGVLPALGAGRRVIALDHRGHGASARAEHYRVRDFAEDALEFLEKHVAGPVALAGHSLGAMTAAVVAARSPDRVRALVLEDPPGSTLGSGIRASRFWMQFSGIRALLATPRGGDDLAAALAELPVQRPGNGAVVKFHEIRDAAALRFGAECLARMDPRVLDPLVEGRWLDDLDWFGELPRIVCPTLLLRADPACGGMLSDDEAARIAASIPRCTRLDLPGLGHGIHSTAPARFAEIVASFLDSIAP